MAHFDGTKTRPTVSANALPGIGLAASLAALIGASCCALPLLLAMVGVGGAWIANLAVFVDYRPYITAAALLITGLGWVIAVRRRSPMRIYVILGFATIMVVGALAVVTYEPQITRYLLPLRQAP